MTTGSPCSNAPDPACRYGPRDSRPSWLPLSPYGCREIAGITVLAAMAAVGAAFLWPPLLILVAAAWLAGILFFRDPQRPIPQDAMAWLAPADGKLTEITPIAHDDRIGGAAVRLGIFLSVLDVHINRSPCAGVVRRIEYKTGRFRNAMNPASSDDNESNTVVLDAGPTLGPVVVKQIAGAIARRIVCAAAIDESLRAGQRFGMIKFGSRTELVLSRPETLEILVQVGDTIRAGKTIMARRRATP